MRYVTASLFVFVTVAAAPMSAGAQQALKLEVLESYGALELQRDGVGCFDVLAAMRLQSEKVSGAFSEETTQAFASGSCVVAASDGALVNAQKVKIEDARLVRATEPKSDVTLYFPEELINADTSAAGVASLTAIAADLRGRVGAWQRCAEERDDLDARIVDFNARVDAFLAEQSEDTVETGSRLKRNDSATVTSVRLSSFESDALRDESEALKAESDAHEERCAAHRAGLTLDQDYLPYYRATKAARS